MPDFADSTTTELERKLVPLRWAALTETVTYCVLFYFWVTGNRPGRLLMGSTHGMIFLGFAAMVLGVRDEMGWTWRYVITVIVLGPIGSVMCYSRLRREGVPSTDLTAGGSGRFRPKVQLGFGPLNVEAPPSR